MHVRQPGLLAGGAQDHLVWQVDHHLAGEGRIGGGGGGGGRDTVEFEHGITGAAVLKNCHGEYDKKYHFRIKVKSISLEPLKGKTEYV